MLWAVLCCQFGHTSALPWLQRVGALLLSGASSIREESARKTARENALKCASP